MTEQLALMPREQFPKKVPVSRLEARLAIARDVIKHLESRKLIAHRGLYISFLEYEADYQVSFEELATSLYVPESKLQCSVCAIGAACMVAVGLYDEAETLEIQWDNARNGYTDEEDKEELAPENIGLDSDGMHEVLGQWFSEEQLALIECAFEGSANWGAEGLSEKDLLKAANFRHRDEYSSEETLRDIFQNILDNKGVFIP